MPVEFVGGGVVNEVPLSVRLLVVGDGDTAAVQHDFAYIGKEQVVKSIVSPVSVHKVEFDGLHAGAERVGLADVIFRTKDGGRAFHVQQP